MAAYGKVKCGLRPDAVITSWMMAEKSIFSHCIVWPEN